MVCGINVDKGLANQHHTCLEISLTSINIYLFYFHKIFSTLNDINARSYNHL